MPNVIPVHPPGKSSGALWLHEIEHVGFGTLCASGPKPHTADVRALEASQFHVADAATLLTSDPTALLYVATVLAQRLDSANRGLLELKRQVSEEPHAQPRLRVRRARPRSASGFFARSRQGREYICWMPMNVCADTSPSAAFSQQAKAIFVQFPRVSIEHPNESRTDAVAFLIRSRVEKEAPLGNGGGGPTSPLTSDERASALALRPCALRRLRRQRGRSEGRQHPPERQHRRSR